MSSIMPQTEKDVKLLEELQSSCCNKLLCNAVTLSCGHTLCDRCFWETTRTATIRDCISVKCKKCGETKDTTVIEFPRKSQLVNLQSAGKCHYFTACEIHTSKFKIYFCSDHGEALCTDCVFEHKSQNCYTESIENKIKEVKKSADDTFSDQRFRNVAECLCSVDDTEMVLDLFYLKIKKRIHDCKESLARDLGISIQDQELIKHVHDDVKRADQMVSHNIFTHNTLDELSRIKNLCADMMSNLKLSEHAEAWPAFVAKTSKDFEHVLEYDGDPIQLSPADWSVYRSSSCVENEKTQPCEPSDSIDEDLDLTANENQYSWIRGYVVSLPDQAIAERKSIRPPRKDGGLLKSTDYRRKLESSWESNSYGTLTDKSIPSDHNTASTTERSQQNLVREPTSPINFAPGMEIRSQIPQVKEDFTVKQCIGIVISDRFILTSNGKRLQKRRFEDSKLIEDTELSNMTCLCLVPSFGEISVLQTNKSIRVYSASVSKWHFKAEITLPYQSICCWKVDQFNTWKSYVFVVSYTNDIRQDCIKMVTINHVCSFPKSDKECECTTPRDSLLLTSESCPSIRGVNSLAVMRRDQRLLISAIDGLVCAEVSRGERAKISWICPFRTNISQIACDDIHVYVCVPNEKRVAKVSMNGEISTTNILPTEVVADLLAVKDNTVLVGSFFHRDWTCKVYRITF